MFVNAYAKAREFTHPIVLSVLRFDGSVETSLGGFVLVNDQGWILTAAHIVNPYFQAQEDAKEILDFENRKRSIESSTSLDAKTKKKQISHLKFNNKWIKNHSFWPGFDRATLSKIIILPENDIALCKVTNLPSDPNRQYPKFVKPANLKHGASLCKIGFPFHSIDSTFDAASNSFTFAPNALPVPLFPLEGIYTREANLVNPVSNKVGKYVETSSPGLKGQSGGPIVDRDGLVCAIQSQTLSLPLGFSPIIERSGRKIEENQFINIGLGVHPEILRKIMSDNGVTFQE